MKRSWLNKSLSSLVLASLIITASSCRSRNPFKKKYGAEVQRINSDRRPSKVERKEIMYSSPPSQEEWEEMTSPLHVRDNKYSYVDVDQFAANKNYLPDKDYYEQMKVYNPSNMVSADLFTNKYITVLASKFRHTGAEFDRIKVPPYDAYGIGSTLSQKPYVMIGNSTLQNSIDRADEDRTVIDIKISKILIGEKKEIRRKQKIAKSFGDEDDVDDLEIADAKKDDFKSKVPLTTFGGTKEKPTTITDDNVVSTTIDNLISPSKKVTKN